jgi:hypothetical protein
LRSLSAAGAREARQIAAGINGFLIVTDGRQAGVDFESRGVELWRGVD